jgi:uncharacterized protein (DUF1778 family)
VSVVKARSRLLSLRLTQDELENLKVASLMQGARNTSDFARNAVLQRAEAHLHPESRVLDRFSGLELRLAEIESVLKHNTDMLRALLKDSVARPPEKARGG